MNPTLQKSNFAVKTDAYEGPFDLVLDLVEERKLLVNDLALAAITDDFITHVRAQEEFPVEEAATFVEIAATLLLVKSKSLIPDLELSEEEAGDVEDLKRRLAAYERVREAARELARIVGRAPMAPSGERPAEPAFAPSPDLSAPALAEALARLSAAREAVERLPEARVKPLVTIKEMMERLMRRVESALALSFSDFSKTTPERLEIVVSFLALLELVKQGVVAAEQRERFGDIRITHATPHLPRYGP